MAVITVSRQFGGNGDEIARAVAARREHHLIDKHTIEQELHRHGINDSELVRYDEKRPTIWAGLSVDREHYEHFLRLAILDVARTGNAVILGRGAHSILSGIPGIVTVRVIAPYELRHNRVVAHFGADDSQADRMIHHNDRDREGFHRHFHGIDWNSPEQYMLTINTGFMDIPTAADTICTVCDHIEAEIDVEQSLVLISQRWLATKVATELQFSEKLVVRYLDVEVEGSTVTLNGVVPSAPMADRCREAVEQIPGVEEVVCNLQEMPQYSYPLI
ncbi:MAG TPA: cytidylate kinase family protein [Alkalispirochaeta sp.]|nr:cytidylate kinase family protein [Alkalispirochaeta sp.]